MAQRLTKNGKPDGRGRNPNSHNLRGNQRTEQTGLESQSIRFVLEMSKWRAIDLSDAEAVEKRYDEYLGLCEKFGTKPLISGLCQSFGISRSEVIKWSSGERTAFGDRLSPASATVMKNILQSFEVFWEYAFQNNGYRNPVTGIFLAKNNFGYKDTSETIVSHKSVDAGPTKAQLEAKYMAALPEDGAPHEIKLSHVEIVRPEDEDSPAD